MAYRLDYVLVDIPESGVAKKQGRIMLETGITESLPETVPIFINLLEFVTPKETYEGILPLLCPACP